MSTPLVYGFQYKFRERNYATDVVAHSEAEAKERIRAIATAVLVGPLVESSENVAQTGGLERQ